LKVQSNVNSPTGTSASDIGMLLQKYHKTHRTGRLVAIPHPACRWFWALGKAEGKRMQWKACKTPPFGSIQLVIVDRSAL
jgi:hypothetical protein